MADIPRILREKPYRRAAETEDQAKIRRQAERERGATEIDRLRNALLAIRQATINGDVCDDVAWFDQIETLHDFCDRVCDDEVKP